MDGARMGVRIDDGTDPSINYRRLAELSDEFTQHWDRLQAFYLDAAAGFCLIRRIVEDEQIKARFFVQGSELDSEEFQDTRAFNYEKIFADAFCTSGIHQATQGVVKARNSPDGSNFITLGQLCLASFYDFWNDYLRREYVIAKGKLNKNEGTDSVIKECCKKYASHDLWGDMYYLRTSIVHNRGVATSDVNKCKLIRWFSPGDLVIITPERMQAIFLAMLAFRNDLFKEQFPKSFIVVTKEEGGD